jgi:hypothetical protein
MGVLHINVLSTEFEHGNRTISHLECVSVLAYSYYIDIYLRSKGHAKQPAHGAISVERQLRIGQ